MLSPERHLPTICDSGPACGAGGSRRDFLREAASLVACAAVLGTPSGRLLQLGATRAAALRKGGGEAVYPIPAQDSATVDREHEVILARDQNRVFAFVLWCPHQRTALRWHDEDRRFQCPKHKSAFQPDGTFLSGRATRDLDRYPLRREGETVVVDLSSRLQQDKDAEAWGRAVVQL